MFKNLKLGIKIGIGFVAVIAIAIILGWVAIDRMNAANENATIMSEENVPEAEVAATVNADIANLMYEMRGYAYTEQKQFWDNAQTAMGKLTESLKKAEDLSKKSERLAGLAEGVKKVNDAKTTYTGLANHTKELIDKMGEIRERMNTLAKNYMDVCYEYLASQNKALADEIKASTDAAKIEDRVWKINTANDIVDLGNTVRLSFWKAQTLRDPKLIQDVMPSFDQINAKLDELKAKTKQEVNLKQIEKCREEGLAYKAGMNEFLTVWLELQDVGKQQTEVATGALEAALAVMHAGLESMVNKSTEAVTGLQAASRTLKIGLTIGTIIGILIAFFLTRMIVKPLQMGVKFAELVASGDMTQQIDLHQEDEIGTLAKALNEMSANLRKSFSEVANNAHSVSSAATELTSISEQMAANAEETQAQSTNVASATEQMTANINNVAAGAEEMAGSVDTVAAAIDEMNSSLAEVAKNCAEGSKIALDADRQARETSTAMNRLSVSANEIGKVIETINTIAQQTNLLALNATIEAARAGEAGKGFAVVANEVKELALQTAKATDEIADKIRGIQNDTGSAVTLIDETTNIISQLNNITQTIASAAEEQSATTGEIAKTVAGLSGAAKDIARNVQEAALAATNISANIQGVSQASQNTASGATETSASAGELSRMAEQLQKIIAQFKV